MNCFYCLILLLVPLTLSYPRSRKNDIDRFLNMYLQEQLAHSDDDSSGNSNEEYVVRRQNMFPFSALRQAQPMCLPNIWTCGPGLPACCPGLMCYDGNAKRGRHCVARG